MRRGITSSIIFCWSSDFSVTDIADARITVSQDKVAVADHALNELAVSAANNSLTLALTQEETLRLQEDRPAEVQLKVKFYGGNVLATPIYRTSVRSILNEEVL